MSTGLLAVGLGLNGVVNDHLFPTDGTGPSADSKCEFESSQVPSGLLEQSPTLPV